MKGWLALAASMACLVSNTSIAAPAEYVGKGFDCRFQTERDRLVSFTVWYGQINKAPVLTPQIQDAEKLFALAGLVAGTRMTVHVKDEWPKQFTLNYFEERGQGRPSSLFTVYEHSNDGTGFLADISQFSLERDATATDKVVALKRYRGICKVIKETTFASFRTGLPK